MRVAVLLLSIAAALGLAPLTLRGVNWWVNSGAENRSYLPSLEFRPTRRSFNDGVIGRLQRSDPAWVLIGDSMLGSRIDPVLLGQISGDGRRSAVLLSQAASGPAWWYLSFKNHLIASGVKPRMTFFFFRDINLTDTLYRLRNHLGQAMDEVALSHEPELDAIVGARVRGGWWQLDSALNRAYQVDNTYAWLHPTIRRWYAVWSHPDPATRLQFENAIEQNFNDNLRRDLAADDTLIEDEADFQRDLPTSVLPLITDLARAHQLPICFVRVQRRPINGQVPIQSANLARYMAELKAWATQQGACFHDDQGDPAMTLDLYADGDHVGDRPRYTRIFRGRLDAVLR